MLSFAEAVHFTASYWTADIVYSRDALVLAQFVLQGRRMVYEAHKKPNIVSGFLSKRAYRVVVLSEGLRKAYEKIGVRKDRIIVAPGAIDPAAFGNERQGSESMLGARARLDLPLDKKIALYVGRLDGWKGGNTLFEASKLLPPDVLTVVIGGEPAHVAELKKQYPQVYFLGSRPYRQLPNNQALADVLVLPNTAKDKDSRLYTLPLKLFAYMASYKPIVASDVPSFREVLSENSAYFFTPDDATSLAQKITEALSGHDLSVSKAAEAHTLVEKYTWTIRAKAILSALSLDK
jgi:glycosyltransferase involved in cell wall biosynthesis